MAWRQAGCVAIAGRAVLIEGPPGIGKSSLALALIDRGAQLVSDDGVLIERQAKRLIAMPHPETRGLIEVRNLGLIDMPVCDVAQVCLVIALDRNAPRYIEAASFFSIESCTVPRIALWPDSPVLAVRAELALVRFGLPLE